MLEPTTSITIAAILFLVALLFGLIISRHGKPYPTLSFTLHKLSGLASSVLLILFCVAFLKTNEPSFHFMMLFILMLIMMAVFTMTGILLSIKNPSRFLRICHSISGLIYLVSGINLLIYWLQHLS